MLVGMDGYVNKDDAYGTSDLSLAHEADTCVVNLDTPPIWKQKHWRLTGTAVTPNKAYRVDLHFYGVVECKNYVGGTGPAQSDSAVVSTKVSHDLWLQGATDSGQDHYMTLAFTVTPNTSDRLVGNGPQDGLPSLANSYVLNQCPAAAFEGHATYRLDFSASISVPGGSYINCIEYDPDCKMIANCGADDGAVSCNGPYNVVSTVTNAVPNTNATFSQPLANTASPPSRGQWWLVDVTNITAQ